MSYEVFFNRPTRQVPIYRLREDMRRATEVLVLASAWFTDDETAAAFVESKAAYKLCLLNKGDLQRRDNNTSMNAVELLKTAETARIAIIGTGNWREGTMHHKFVVADNVVWFGSYNITYNSRRNYEVLVRVEDQDTARTFAREAHAIAQESHASFQKPEPRLVIRTIDDHPRVAGRRVQVREPITRAHEPTIEKCNHCGEWGHEENTWGCCDGCSMQCGSTCSECGGSTDYDWGGTGACLCRYVNEADAGEMVEKFKVGDRVHHSGFGEGVVLSVEAFGGDEQVKVLFDGASIPRVLSLAYASLRLVA